MAAYLTNLDLTGDSAGGNLAAAVALKLRDEEVTPSLQAQVLMYPALQMQDMETPSMQQHAEGPAISR